MEILLDKNLLARWCELWHRVGARSTPEPIFDELVQQYGEPHRAYHTLNHIQDCLQEFDQARALVEQANEVELALWCHDVIYDPQAADNETRSAAWAGKILMEGGVATKAIMRIQDLILATRHNTPPDRPDTALLVDIDLASLGYTAATFDRNNAAIRHEYQQTPAATYRAARIRVLESFLARPAIYQTEWFHDRYEVQARENLARAIQDLRDAAL
jgi:predicted metal-dependent HD superfamily phosphohydrolase